MARVIIALGTAREFGRPGRRNARARAIGTVWESVMHHALRDDVQKVYLVALAAKVLERPVDHHLAVRRAVDGEQDLAQRQGRLGLVHGGHLVIGGRKTRGQPAYGRCRELRDAGREKRRFGRPERGGSFDATGRARTMTGTATFVASSATRARTMSDFASRVVPVMARGEKSCGR